MTILLAERVDQLFDVIKQRVGAILAVGERPVSSSHELHARIDPIGRVLCGLQFGLRCCGKCVRSRVVARQIAKAESNGDVPASVLSVHGLVHLIFRIVISILMVMFAPIRQGFSVVRHGVVRKI